MMGPSPSADSPSPRRWIGNRNPFTVLGFAGIPLAFTLGWGGSGAAISILVVSVAALLEGMFRRFLFGLSLVTAPLMFFLAIVSGAGLLAGDSPAQAVRHLGFFSIRIVSLVAIGHMVRLTIDIPRLRAALVQSPLPPGVAFVILAPLGLVSSLRSRARRVVDALHARGQPTTGGWIHRVRLLGWLGRTLVMASLLEAQERALALEARGFVLAKPGSTSFLEPGGGPKERTAGRAAVVFSILILLSGWAF